MKKLSNDDLVRIERLIDRRYGLKSPRGQVELFRVACSSRVERRLSRRMEALCSIRNKAGEIQRIRFNAAQRKLLAIVVRAWRNNKPARVVILKPRQTGFSTVIELLLFIKCTEKSNRRASVVAHKRTISVKVLQMFKTAQKHAPFRLPMKRNASDLVYFADPIDSSIDLDSAEAEEPGHGDTVQFLHTTEVSRWKKPEQKMKGLFQTVPDLPGTLVAVESTANGVGGYFFDLWNATVDGRNEFVGLFVAWFEHEEYTTEVLSEAEKVYLVVTLTKEEETLLQMRYFKRKVGWVMVSLAQLAWRRRTLETKCNGDLDVFHEQYPATPEEAFVASGRPVFNADHLKARYTVLTPPIWRGDIIDANFKPRDIPDDPVAPGEQRPESTVTVAEMTAAEVKDIEEEIPWQDFGGERKTKVQALDLDEHAMED